jgi:beta-glucosidase/6-phospho-beta-glucosidase/beta-galactosidase
MKIVPPPRPFPAGFSWGFAAAAPQIEGAAFTGGKGASVWDTFARVPGAVANGDTLDVACDHYHRYEQDFAPMAGLGARHNRLSIAWPRIFPAAGGQVNAAGIAFYNRLIDSALAHGLTPWVTMYHWDTPQWVEGAHGGWRSRAGVAAFADYADTIVRAFGDRVKHWITVYEVFCFTRMSYGTAERAPGLALSEQVVNQTCHHALLAHGHGVRSVVITENGAGYDDAPPAGGEVVDLHRRDYLRNYLRELQRAIDDGVPVHGYFLWSFMDNFEWGDGYNVRFGVVYTDYATQQRTPKASARWYSAVMAANAIV